MNSPTKKFWHHASENFWISLGFSTLGAIGFVPGVPGNTASKIGAALFFCVFNAAIFSSILSLAQTFVLPRTKVPSFLGSLMLVALTYLMVILTAIPIGIAITTAFITKSSPWSPQTLFIIRQVLDFRIVLLAFLMMVAITFFFMISKKLGPGVLLNWILGRYYQPRQEQRVFMFLDLRDSTRLGEELGDLKFSRLIQKFFADLSEPILGSRGEVSHYIGDEAVITWKHKQNHSPISSIDCFFAIKDLIDSKASEYVKDFGVVPGFKSGIHSGNVIATQVGEIKSEIVFHGDVLNTTSRIQSLCNELGAELLVSSAIKEAVDNDPRYKFESMGFQHLKGKVTEIEVFSVTRKS